MEKLLSHNDSGSPLKICVKDVVIGGSKKVIISGPCAVEDYDTMDKICSGLKDAGVDIIRGGTFKPRTSPYDFQGLGFLGLEIMKEMSLKYGLPVVSEIMDVRDIEKSLDYIHMIQVGSRNMYNYVMLKELGKLKVPVLLKRGMGATLNEWLNAAEYILKEGNSNVVLCERGIRTFESATRNTLDLNSVAIIKENYRLPVIVDPSHGTGRADIVKRMSFAALAAGADGLIIESHVKPSTSISDSSQTISLEVLNEIIKEAPRFSL